MNTETPRDTISVVFFYDSKYKTVFDDHDIKFHESLMRSEYIDVDDAIEVFDALEELGFDVTANTTPIEVLLNNTRVIDGGAIEAARNFISQVEELDDSIPVEVYEEYFEEEGELPSDYGISYYCKEPFESSEETIGSYYFEECGYAHSMPESLRGYFDTEAFGCDIMMSGNFIETDNYIIELV